MTPLEFASLELSNKRVLSSVPAAQRNTWAFSRHPPSQKTIDEGGFFYQACIFIYAEFANHYVRDCFQPAGSEGVRQKKVDRACQAVDPKGATRFADRHPHLFSRRDKALHASRPRRLIRNKISVRILGQAISTPLHPKYR